jgi:hypothetical protein
MRELLELPVPDLDLFIIQAAEPVKAECLDIE